MNVNQAICLNCGCATGTGVKYCANCSAELNPNAVACMSCGVAIDFGIPKQTTTSGISGLDGDWRPPGKEKIVAILLVFFLGGFGIHNFYLGETKKGVLKLVLCWCFIGGILALIDFIRMLIGKYEVNPDKLI